MTSFHTFCIFMLYLTVISAPLHRWVPNPSPLPVDPTFPVFIPLPSRAGACSLSWGKNATRFYLLSFSPGFWHLCILFWYLRVHCIKGSPERKKKKISVAQVFMGQGRIHLVIFPICSLYFVHFDRILKLISVLDPPACLFQLADAQLNDNMSHLMDGKKYKDGT